jgi:hypothetical protein
LRAKKIDLDPCPEVDVDFEVHQEVGHPRIPLDQFADQASPLLGRRGEMAEEVATEFRGGTDGTLRLSSTSRIPDS